jgi:hypothetical protein
MQKLKATFSSASWSSFNSAAKNKSHRACGVMALLCTVKPSGEPKGSIIKIQAQTNLV